MMIEVDAGECRACGTCVGVCPRSALLLIFEELVYDSKQCCHCLICIDICPTHAIREA
ncbi:MAG: 4Fe-4S binding protein [Candidatus Delongbacteria bacterium]|nr:4Fe-4S binding protein [Candidatus Delongbacteria bacterium]